MSSKTNSVIMEIRAGAGGKEAALFAKDLFKMYSKYASSKNWRLKILDSHSTDLGGLKEIVFKIKDDNPYSKMKFEAGVHRVQRIPQTEKGDRIHTSTVSVAVLPAPKSTEVKLDSNDLKFDFFRASGPGGQHVNRRSTAVRATHKPTGIVASSQSERSQHQNKKNALDILRAKISERKQSRKKAKLSGKRKSQIGKAKRAEKIRTYNFHKDRITDHRIGKKWRNINQIVEGNLDPVIRALQKNIKE